MTALHAVAFLLGVLVGYLVAVRQVNKILDGEVEKQKKIIDENFDKINAAWKDIEANQRKIEELAGGGYRRPSSMQYDNKDWIEPN